MWCAHSLFNMKSISELVADLKRYNDAYRLGDPIISDAQYDALVAELRELDPSNEWFRQAEPAPVSKGRKVKLPIPMKSLNKVKSLTEFKQWAKSLALPPNAKLVITPKYDGVSWLHDELTHKTYSRGGAENEGQDCSEHFTKGKFDEVSSEFPHPIAFSFGELVFSRYNWQTEMAGRISDSTGEPYKSPRNTVAGFINRDEAPIDIIHASFIRYGVDETSLSEWHSFADLLEDLSIDFNQYINTPEGQKYPFDEKQLQDITEDYLAVIFKLWRQYYYIDGLVIYIDDLNLWNTIGRQQTSGNPLYAIAYKHPDFTDIFETTVKGIDWKVSKAGALKPVVNIEAVDTGDCTMENPTGYNAKYIFDNGIGAGAVIEVTRSGGVIPKIINVRQEASQETMMEQRDSLLYCADCGKPTSWNDSKVELVCTNPDCPGIRLAKIVHFYTILGAEQMGEETIAKMFNAGYDTLRRILDITFDELLLIDGFGESIANTILDANSKIREGVEITKLMHSSDCFQGIGQVKAKTILSELLEIDRTAFINGYILTEDGFDQTPEFLSLNKTMQSFIKGITPFYKFVAENKLTILPMEEKPQVTGDKYSGMKVCFTGIRDKGLEAEIVAQGGEVVSGVSKKTTHLIVADMNSTSSKMAKAQSLGIPIFTVENFKAL